jgi:hypothetical protein
MRKSKTLPQAFREFEEFLDWALPTETARRQKREASTMEEIREFYDAMVPKVPAILDHFRAAEAAAGGHDKVDSETRLLFTLMLALADASLSIEIHKSPTVPDGLPGDLWKPEHDTPGWKSKPKIKLFPKEPVARQQLN